MNQETITILTSRDKFVLAWLALGLVWNFFSSLVGWGWITATIITFGILIIAAIYIYHKRDGLLAKFILFGVIAGLVELLADRYLVEVTGTLVYEKGGPFLLRSPLYMPFAWAGVLVTLGYVGWRLRQVLGLPWATFLAGIIGAINIPLYEQWARSAHWWYYQNTPMLGATPWYIIVGEFFIVALLPFLLQKLEILHPVQIIPLGIIEGLWIWICYALTFQLLG